jgi:co-chaperonin GroES (HSP10)
MIVMRLLGNRVMIEPEDEFESTTSKITIPDEARKRKPFCTSKVLLVGDLVSNVSVGEKIIYRPTSITKIELEGKQFGYLGADEIIAVIGE